jgi:hypothetical protein
MYKMTFWRLGEIAKDAAQQQYVRFADAHTVMMETIGTMKVAHGGTFSCINNNGEVHSAFEGQLTMTYAYLKGLGCDGNIETITVDMASGYAHATLGQTIISAKHGSIEVETSRYPYCFTLQPRPQPLPAFVKGLTGSGAQVRWGQSTKQFSKKRSGVWGQPRRRVPEESPLRTLRPDERRTPAPAGAGLPEDGGCRRRHGIPGRHADGLGMGLFHF